MNSLATVIANSTSPRDRRTADRRAKPSEISPIPYAAHSTAAPSDAQATVIHGPVSLSAITMAANVNANARAWANGTLARRFTANHAIAPFHALRMPATIAVEPALS